MDVNVVDVAIQIKVISRRTTTHGGRHIESLEEGQANNCEASKTTCCNGTWNKGSKTSVL